MDGVTPVPVNLSTLVRSNVVLLAEGEKDALNLQKAVTEFPNEGGSLTYAGTTNIGGALKWLDSYSPFIAGKRLFVFQDNDDPGMRHAQQVCASVSKYEQAVHLLELTGLAQNGDVSDFLEDHTSADLFSVMKTAPVWTSPIRAVPPSTTPGDGLKLVRLGELLSQPVLPVDYLLAGRLVAGSVSIIASKPKCGNPTFARNLALAEARGRVSLAGTSSRARFCLALEVRLEDVAADFRAMGAPKSDGNRYTRPEG